MANNHSNNTIIRVTPTLSTDTYAQGDVLFNPTAIPDAVLGNGGCSKLIAMYTLNQNLTDLDIAFIFSEGSTVLGTINATANIAHADIEALNIIAVAKQDANEGQTSHLDNAEITRVFLGFNNTNTEGTGASILLQAAAGSTSVYVSAILEGSGTPTLAADDIDLIFHIEYR